MSGGQEQVWRSRSEYGAAVRASESIKGGGAQDSVWGIEGEGVATTRRNGGGDRRRGGDGPAARWGTICLSHTPGDKEEEATRGSQ